MSEYEAGAVVAEGKTKTLRAVMGHGGLVLVENKPDITADDDPDKTRRFASKALYATETTCNVFELLAACGVPVSYQGRHSETVFVALKSNMWPVELVTRRVFDGSYLKRKPHMVPGPDGKLQRAHHLVVEFFLKTTGGKFGELVMPKYAIGKDAGKVIDDPFIVDHHADKWVLAHPKAPAWTPEAVDGAFPAISRQEIMASFSWLDDPITKIERIVRQVSYIIEKAWAILGVDWCDMKIEIDDQGRVSDVVDNDSWRIRQDGKQLDKQVFRDKGGDALAEVEAKYGLVARLSSRFGLPRQALVVARGSANDDMPKIPDMPGVEVVDLVRSGHKSTVKLLQDSERLYRDFPQGGVIIAAVGRSNGLGPTEASHSPWPVISFPATLKDFPDDAWSSLRCPSKSPNLTAWPVDNVIGAAMQILGQTNPAVYAMDRLDREGLDEYDTVV